MISGRTNTVEGGEPKQKVGANLYRSADQWSDLTWTKEYRVVDDEEFNTLLVDFNKNKKS